MNVRHKKNIKETPRNLSQGARHSAKYRGPHGPAKYFAPYRTRRIVDENIDPKDLEVPSSTLKTELCPLLWDGDKLNSRVKESLMRVTKKFIEYLGVKIKVKDVILTGSMANYNWTDKSDIDIHVLVDHKDIDGDEELVSEFLSAKKKLWNSQYSIRIKGHDVEMYVQDVASDLFAQGVYSIPRDMWVRKPEPKKGKLDIGTAKVKAAAIIDMIDGLDSVKDDEKRIKRVERIKDKMKNLRSVGLAKPSGEFSAENLAFKILRNSGYIDKLMKVNVKAFNNYFSLNESSKSKAQQRFFGMVRAAQKGDMPSASGAVKKAAASMSTSDVKDFASTKHKKLPEKVDEDASPKYEYGCLMASFSIPIWDKIGDVIAKEDVYEGDGGYGIEKEPHVTILFGFHDELVDPKQLKLYMDSLLGEEALVFKLGKASLFKSPEYDVLKFDIEETNGLLTKLNAAVRKKYKYTNEYPEYHPHATIAYIKKGEGQKYADMINEADLSFDVVSDKMVYSKPPKPTKYFWKLDSGYNYLELDPTLDMPKEKLEIIKDFICFVRQKLGIQQRVYVSLKNGRDDTIRTTAAYSPMDDKNSIRCNGRALIDILRSIAHEMVHNKQREAGKFKVGQEVQNIGGKIEGEADAKAGRLIKDFTHNHGYDHVYDY